jgi:hypothetical protein
MWPEEAQSRTLSATVIARVLPSAQRDNLSQLPNALAALLHCLGESGPARLKSQARLCSCGCRSASTFLGTMPMAAQLTIPDTEFASVMHHCLGLSQTPLRASDVLCDCAEQPYTCTKCMRMCHNLLSGAHCAGVVNVVEPALERLRASTGSTSLQRCNMVLLLPEAWLSQTRFSGPSCGHQLRPARSP